MARAKTLRPWPETIGIAPGELALVQAFLNTEDGVRGIDELANATALAGWLIQRRLVPPGFVADGGDVQRVREVRDALRTVIRARARGRSAEAAAARLNRLAQEGGVRVFFAADGGLSFAAVSDGLGGALGQIFAALAQGQAAGQLERFKICDGPKCGRAYFDTSPGVTARWCSMKICGNRAKARAFRRRHPDRPRPSWRGIASD